LGSGGRSLFSRRFSIRLVCRQRSEGGPRAPGLAGALENLRQSRTIVNGTDLLQPPMGKATPPPSDPPWGLRKRIWLNEGHKLRHHRPGRAASSGLGKLAEWIVRGGEPRDRHAWRWDPTAASGAYNQASAVTFPSKKRMKETYRQRVSFIPLPRTRRPPRRTGPPKDQFRCTRIIECQGARCVGDQPYGLGERGQNWFAPARRRSARGSLGVVFRRSNYFRARGGTKPRPLMAAEAPWALNRSQPRFTKHEGPHRTRGRRGWASMGWVANKVFPRRWNSGRPGQLVCHARSRARGAAIRFPRFTVTKIAEQNYYVGGAPAPRERLRQGSITFFQVTAGETASVGTSQHHQHPRGCLSASPGTQSRAGGWLAQPDPTRPLRKQRRPLPVAVTGAGPSRRGTGGSEGVMRLRVENFVGAHGGWEAALPPSNTRITCSRRCSRPAKALWARPMVGMRRPWNRCAWEKVPNRMWGGERHGTPGTYNRPLRRSLTIGFRAQ